jgi:hypothetical protein
MINIDFKKIWTAVLTFLNIIIPFINEWIIPAIGLVNVIKQFIKEHQPSDATPFDGRYSSGNF